jgi:cation transport ATPase
VGAITVRFDVEHAGCATCAERVQKALAPLATVEQITVDESSDTATVSISTEGPIEDSTVNAALTRASAGSGHDYRVKEDSWTVAP